MAASIMTMIFAPLFSTITGSPSLLVGSPLLRTNFKDNRVPGVTVKPTKVSKAFHPLIRAQGTPDYEPEAKFYKVEAILRPWKIHQVSKALLEIGVGGVTLSSVKGFGSQGRMKERQARSEFGEDIFRDKVKMEIVVVKDKVEGVLDTVIEHGKTGKIGDGKIFVVPVADVIKVRTGERGERAERMTGDLSSSSHA